MSNENRKRAVSIRMSAADISKVKRLAQRLGVRDSDVIRYAVKSMLSKLAPLYDPHVKGRSLVPMFVESGSDLFLHFDIDAMRLDGIINEDAEDDRKVDHEDIQLIAMSGAQQPAGRWRMAPVSRAAMPRMETAGVSDLRSAGDERTETVAPSLQDYLYGKYVYRSRNEA
jgi:hypothetical protein